MLLKKTIKNFQPAKIWLEPEVELSKIGDFKKNEITEIVEIAKVHKDLIISQINRFFNNETIEVIKL